MSKKVLITGATRDTGRASVREAIAVGLDVRAMVRKIDERSEALVAQGAGVVVGDLSDINSICIRRSPASILHLPKLIAPALLFPLDPVVKR